MDSLSFPEIPCVICGKLLDLQVDLFADESGKSVHEKCYVAKVCSRRKVKPLVSWSRAVYPVKQLSMVLGVVGSSVAANLVLPLPRSRCRDQAV